MFPNQWRNRSFWSEICSEKCLDLSPVSHLLQSYASGKKTPRQNSAAHFLLCASRRLEIPSSLTTLEEDLPTLYSLQRALVFGALKTKKQLGHHLKILYGLDPLLAQKPFSPTWAQTDRASRTSGVGPKLLPAIGPNTHLPFPFSPLADFESEELKWRR